MAKPAATAAETSASPSGASLAWIQRERDVRRAWSGARAWTAAVVTALFPVLFLLDDRVAWTLSPILPGLAVLAATVVLLPIVVFERVAARAARLPEEARARSALRFARAGRTALVGAWLWLAVWLLGGM